MSDEGCKANVILHHGDCLELLPTLPDNSVDSAVTDPPYHLTTGKKGGTGPASVNLNSPAGRARITVGFMGKGWDGGDVAHKPELWKMVHRVAKPGAHLLAFGGTRTFHRLACAIEDAGWEIRDCLMWVYGTGFPKSLDVSKAMDKAAGVDREDKFEGSFDRRCGPTGNRKCEECGKWLVSGSPCRCPRPQDRAVSPEARRWEGFGTALKPAWEPIILARKPLEGTVAANVQRWGTGALNIDGCRIATTENLNGGAYSGGERPRSAMGCTGEVVGTSSMLEAGGGRLEPADFNQPAGRWPANVIHDGSDEVLAGFPANASRFFYCAKASRAERDEGLPEGQTNKHPTVKPLALMRYLCRLVMPPGGTVLDPFMGSGSTGRAARQEGFGFIGMELEAESFAVAQARIKECGLGTGVFAPKPKDVAPRDSESGIARLIVLASGHLEAGNRLEALKICKQIAASDLSRLDETVRREIARLYGRASSHLRGWIPPGGMLVPCLEEGHQGPCGGTATYRNYCKLCYGWAVVSGFYLSVAEERDRLTAGA